MRGNQRERGALTANRVMQEGGGSGEPSAPADGSAEVPGDEVRGVAGEAWERRSEPKRPARQVHRAARQAHRAGAKPGRGGVGRAVLAATLLVIVGNLAMLTLAFPAGHWQIFEQGWPIEFFMASWGLCVIMYIASSIWMLIPVGLLLGNGALMAYSSLTGDWEHWNTSWLLEIWIGFVSFLLPVFLSRWRRLARWLSRLFALLLSLASVAGIVYVGWSAGAGNVLYGLGGLFFP